MFRRLRSDGSCKRTQIKNRVNMISLENQATFEQIISKSIRRASSGDIHLHLKTLGRPMLAKVNANQEAPRIFFAEDAI